MNIREVLAKQSPEIQSYIKDRAKELLMEEAKKVQLPYSSRIDYFSILLVSLADEIGRIDKPY